MNRDVQIEKLTEHLKLRLEEEQYLCRRDYINRFCNVQLVLLKMQNCIYIINHFPCKKVSISQDAVPARPTISRRSLCTIRVRMTKTKHLEYGDFSIVTYEKDYHTHRYVDKTSILMDILNVNWTEIFRHAKKYKAHYMEQYLHSIRFRDGITDYRVTRYSLPQRLLKQQVQIIEPLSRGQEERRTVRPE